MKEKISGTRMAAIKEAIARINRSPLSQGLVSVCGENEERAVCQIGTGDKIDYFSFPIEDLDGIVSAISVPGTIRAEKITSGYRFMGGEQASLRLVFEIQNGQSVFSVTKLETPKS